MNMSPAAIDALIKPSETCRLIAYLGPRDSKQTIGWGHTGRDVYRGLVWTQAQADAALASDIDDAERLTSGAFWDARQYQFDAINDMMYNIGPGTPKIRDGIIWLASGTHSTLYLAWKAGDYASVEIEIPKWNHSGGVVMPGLVTRRAKDLCWFKSGNLDDYHKAAAAT